MPMTAKQIRRTWGPRRIRMDMTALGGSINQLIMESESVNTISELADRAGIAPSVMGEIIMGEIKSPGRDVLVKIANALSVDVDTLTELINDDLLRPSSLAT